MKIELSGEAMFAVFCALCLILGMSSIESCNARNERDAARDQAHALHCLQAGGELETQEDGPSHTRNVCIMRGTHAQGEAR